MSLQKRMENEQRMPPAAQSMLGYVWGKCAESDLVIDKDLLVFVGRAVNDFLMSTPEGRRLMLKLLNAEVNQGSYMKQYFKAGGLGDPEKQLDYRHVMEYNGFIYKDQAVPGSFVEIASTPDLEVCDGCSGRFPRHHCAKQVRTNHLGREYLEMLCNHCRMHHNDMKIRNEAVLKTCNECAHTVCHNHPARLQDQHDKKLAAATKVVQHAASAQPPVINVPSAPVATSNRYSS